jgi:hypothetical protein
MTEEKTQTTLNVYISNYQLEVSDLTRNWEMNMRYTWPGDQDETKVKIFSILPLGLLEKWMDDEIKEPEGYFTDKWIISCSSDDAKIVARTQMLVKEYYYRGQPGAIMKQEVNDFFDVNRELSEDLDKVDADDIDFQDEEVISIPPLALSNPV